MPEQIAPWLPLLRDLSATCPGWSVWKNIEDALEGRGDVDSVAPESEWGRIEAQFLAWAAHHGLGPAITCRHSPGVMFLVTPAASSSQLYELDVKERATYAGVTLFRAGDLAPLLVDDPRGFPRLRPGAEGLFKLVLHGLRLNGGPKPERLTRERVRELLADDPEGVQAAAALFGVGAGPVLNAATAAARGGWDRPSMIRLEMIGLLRAVSEPSVLARRAQFRLSAKRTCPVISAIVKHGRTIPGERGAWLREVAASHPVQEIASP